MKDKIEVVAFDADDTLWENEVYFQEFEHQFCDLLKAYQPQSAVSQELFKTEMKNLHMYGYGLKSMMLSMIETACRITGGEGNMHCVKEIVRLGQELLQRPVTLLDGVEEVLLRLQGKYRLVLATKGDLFDQRRKVRESGLMHYFCHIEIMSDKKEADYRTYHRGMRPAEFPDVGKLRQVGHTAGFGAGRICSPHSLPRHLAV